MVSSSQISAHLQKKHRMSTTVSQQIDEAIAGLSVEPIGHINFDGQRYAALPLFGTLGEVWLLRPDGSLWRADSETGSRFEPLPVHLHTTALVAGLQRYPWLKQLLPQRPANASSCNSCGGQGRIGPENTLFCHICGALGWRSPNDEPTS
jgi:hypothetical protein